MSTLEIQVREDGTVLIPADHVATAGAGPGERVAIELRPRPAVRQPSRGILRGHFSAITGEQIASDRAERLAEFEYRRDL